MIIIILKLLFFGPYLRGAVGKIVGKKKLVTSCWSGEKKREIRNSVFRVDLVQKFWWFVRPKICKEKGMCVQKLQAVVITFLFFYFFEEYIILKRTLTTLISLRCTGNVRA